MGVLPRNGNSFRFAPIKKSVESESNEALPEHFDARERWPECLSLLDSIKDQSNCGSCWVNRNYCNLQYKHQVVGILVQTLGQNPYISVFFMDLLILQRHIFFMGSYFTFLDTKYVYIQCIIIYSPSFFRTSKNKLNNLL